MRNKNSSRNKSAGTVDPKKSERGSDKVGKSGLPTPNGGRPKVKNTCNQKGCDVRVENPPGNTSKSVLKGIPKTVLPCDIVDDPKKEPTIIMILGSSHSGTTILKSLIGSAKRCHEVVGELRSGNIKGYINEAKQSAKLTDCDFIVVKRPPCGLYAPREHISPSWKNIVRILITRNPISICNSWNERAAPYRNCSTRFKQLEYIADAIATRQKAPNTYYIRYEDMFDNNFGKLKTILDSIGLDYDDTIFDTKNRGALSHRGMHDVSRDRPPPIDHEKFRTWQINQPFVNFDENKKNLRLTVPQKLWLTDNPTLGQIYPDLPETIRKTKLISPSAGSRCGLMHENRKLK